MAKNFLDQDPDLDRHKIGYMDGFRFGFGFFIGWLLGSSILALVIGGVVVIANQLR